MVGALVVDDDDEVMLISDQGKIIRMKVGGINVLGRNTQGVKLIGLEPGERLVGVAKPGRARTRTRVTARPTATRPSQ